MASNRLLASVAAMIWTVTVAVSATASVGCASGAYAWLPITKHTAAQRLGHNDAADNVCCFMQVDYAGDLTRTPKLSAWWLSRHFFKPGAAAVMSAEDGIPADAHTDTDAAV